MSKLAQPNVTTFKLSELREVEEGGLITVPEFQRWVIEDNVKDIKISIETVGILRCPVICLVRGKGKQKDKHYIVDGNHLRRAVLHPSYGKSLDSELSCILIEKENYQEAALAFSMLNTKGVDLDLVDSTKLWTDVKGHNSIYASIWSLFFKEPENRNQAKVNLADRFTAPTVVEFMCGADKSAYKEGKYVLTDPNKDKNEIMVTHFIHKKNLLSHLFEFSANVWDKELEKTKKPNGASILGFAKLWFTYELFELYSEADFVNFVTNIYLQNSSKFDEGFYIGRDNATRIMRDYLFDTHGFDFGKRKTELEERSKKKKV